MHLKELLGSLRLKTRLESEKILSDLTATDLKSIGHQLGMKLRGNKKTMITEICNNLFLQREYATLRTREPSVIDLDDDSDYPPWKFMDSFGSFSFE